MNETEENEKAALEKTDEAPVQSETVANVTQPGNPAQGPYSEKVDELEALLENLQGKLSDVVAQIDYVKRIRDDLYAKAQTLQKGLESCDDITKTDEEQEKKAKDVLFEIRTRGQVIKILEKKELLLSHAILSVVSNWADEMEKNLESRKSKKSLQEEQMQPVTEPSHIMTN